MYAVYPRFYGMWERKKILKPWYGSRASATQCLQLWTHSHPGGTAQALQLFWPFSEHRWALSACAPLFEMHRVLEACSYSSGWLWNVRMGTLHPLEMPSSLKILKKFFYVCFKPNMIRLWSACEMCMYLEVTKEIVSRCRPLWTHWWEGLRIVVWGDNKATSVLAANWGSPWFSLLRLRDLSLRRQLGSGLSTKRSVWETYSRKLLVSTCISYLWLYNK